MKNYTITVNGNVYDVTVEEKGAGPHSPDTVQETNCLQNMKIRKY